VAADVEEIRKFGGEVVKVDADREWHVVYSNLNDERRKLFGFVL
jgi:hypothetical protein